MLVITYVSTWKEGQFILVRDLSSRRVSSVGGGGGGGGGIEELKTP